MKKILLLGIVLSVLLIGCGEDISPCKNETIVVNNTIIKEVEVVRPCICDCNDTITECETQEISDASRKLIACNVKYDDLNDMYYDCLMGNNSQYMEDLKSNYTDCLLDLAVLKNATN